MRRLIVLASVAAVLTLAGCAPEGGTDAVEPLSPSNAATYTADATPSIEEIDLDVWAAGFMPSTTATDDGARKTEVLHAGETESASYEVDGTARLQLACAADEATSLTVSIDDGAGEAAGSTVVCAAGVTAEPAITDIALDTASTVTLTASVDTAIAIQLAGK